MKNILLKITKHNIFILFTLLFILNNCIQDDSYNTEESGNYVKFSAQSDIVSQNTPVKVFSQEKTHDGKYLIDISINESKWGNEVPRETKTSWGSTGGSVQWSSGDAVGIYIRRSTGIADPNIDRSNIQYVTSSNTNSGSLTTSVTPPLSFPISPSDYVNFYAYYPYSWVPQSEQTVPSLVQFPTQQSMNNLTLNYIIPTNQTGSSALSNSDLMYAVSQSKNNSNLSVPLSFNHALSLLTFAITSTDFNGITLTQLSLSGNKVTNNGSLNLLTQQLTPGSTTFTPTTTLNQTLNNTTPIYSDMIINPCTVAGTTTDMKLTFAIGNINYTCAIPANTFLTGHRYTVNINIRNTQGNNIIVNVGYGGQAQIGSTIIPSGGKGSFNNSGSALTASLTAQSGWVPYAVITDNASPVILSPSQQSYTVPQNSVSSSVTILFQPSSWYPTSGLVIHYDGIFSGGYGITNANTNGNTTWADLSGNRNNGTLNNFNFASTSGWVNNSLSFDGTDDYVAYNGTMTSSFTMNFVINIASGTQNTSARLTGEANYPSFVLSSGNIGINTVVVLGLVYTTTQINPVYTPTRSQNIQLTMACSNRTVSLYVNGTLYGQASISNTSFPSSASTAYLGIGRNLLNLLFTGAIKANYNSFMLYNRALTSTEIQNMYTFNRSRFGMP